MDICTCDGLIMKTNLYALDGKIEYPTQHNSPDTINILNVEPSVAEDGGFIFYDELCPQVTVCTVAYEEKRGRPELCYDTEFNYRRKGHMTHAMNCVLNWCREDSVRGMLWLLIEKENTASKKIARRFGFIPQGCFLDSHEWYCLDLGSSQKQE